MTTIEHVLPREPLDRMLSACFRGGELRRRELRLTAEAAHAIAKTYPTTQVRHLDGCWYEISFEEVPCHG